MPLKISSRKSDLARLQSYLVGSAVQNILPDVEINFHFKESLGDVNLTDPLWKMPEKGVFTQDFYRDLVDEKTDAVVHSWKDLPVETKPDCEIVATLKRADQRDLLLVKKNNLTAIKSSRSLRIYSSSPRRFYNIEPFLKTYFPFGLDLVQFESVRGNIQTRIRKYFAAPEIDGIVLAKAALDRLLSADQPEFNDTQKSLRAVLKESRWMVLPLTENPNAAAQGALAIEIRNDRKDLVQIFAQINHAVSYRSVQKEREILSSHGGGCHQKIGVSVLDHPYGEVIFVKGLTDTGQKLDVHVLENPAQKLIEKKFTPEQTWCSEPSNVFFDRIPLDWKLPGVTVARTENVGVIVTKAAALSLTATPYLHDLDVVWTAGLPTWKNLAARGIWVNGSSESLGENFMLEVGSLTDANVCWYKLSHDDSESLLGHGSATASAQTIATYRLERNDLPFNFEGRACFFWNSGSLFIAAATEHPEILSRVHCCAPGHTAQIIQGYLDKKLGYPSLWKNLFVFLNHDQWRSYVTE